MKLKLSLLNYFKEEAIFISLIFVLEFERGTCHIIEIRTLSIKDTPKILFQSL